MGNSCGWIDWDVRAGLEVFGQKLDVNDEERHIMFGATYGLHPHRCCPLAHSNFAAAGRARSTIDPALQIIKLVEVKRLEGMVFSRPVSGRLSVGDLFMDMKRRKLARLPHGFYRPPPKRRLHVANLHTQPHTCVRHWVQHALGQSCMRPSGPR